MASKTKQSISDTSSEVPIDETSVGSDGLFEAISEPAGLISKTNFLIDSNESLEKLLSYSRDELRSHSILTWVMPDDRRTLTEGLEAVRNGTILRQFTCRYICGDSHVRRLEWICTPFPEDEKIFVQVRDITYRMWIEGELRESTRLLELSAHGANLGSWEANLQTGEITYSDISNAMLGFGPGEKPPQQDLFLGEIHPDDFSRVREAWSDCASGISPSYEVEYRVRHKSGAWRWILARGRVVEYSETGGPARMAGARFDITDRKNVELRAVQNEETLTTLIDATPNPVFLVEADGTITAANQAIAQRFGHTLVTLIGSNIYDVIPQDRVDQYREIARDLIRDKRDLRIEVERNDRHFEFHIYPILDDEDRVSRAAVIGRDITEELLEKVMEEQHQSELAHAARLSTLGEMASGLAHEINQPLCGISSAAQGGLRRIENNECQVNDLLPILQLISDQAHRGGEIMKRMRRFARRQTGTKGACAIGEIIGEAMELVRHQIKRKEVRIQCDTSNRLPAILGDPIEIEQVVLNLIRNAIDAIASRPVSDRVVSLNTRVVLEKESIEVSVSDLGIGLAQDVRERLFQPFVTTKPDGLGMGLSISRSIIEAHGGRLWAEDNRPQGTVFRFTLPIARKS